MSTIKSKIMRKKFPTDKNPFSLNLALALTLFQMEASYGKKGNI